MNKLQKFKPHGALRNDLAQGLQLNKLVLDSVWLSCEHLILPSKLPHFLVQGPMFEGLQNRMAIEMCVGPTSEKACNHGLEPCGPE